MSQTESWAKKVKEILRKLFLLFYQSFSVQTDQPIEMWPTKTHEMCRKKYLAKYLRDIMQWLWCLNWCFFFSTNSSKISIYWSWYPWTVNWTDKNIYVYLALLLRFMKVKWRGYKWWSWCRDHDHGTEIEDEVLLQFYWYFGVVISRLSQNPWGESIWCSLTQNSNILDFFIVLVFLSITLNCQPWWNFNFLRLDLVA